MKSKGKWNYSSDGDDDGYYVEIENHIVLCVVSAISLQTTGYRASARRGKVTLQDSTFYTRVSAMRRARQLGKILLAGLKG